MKKIEIPKFHETFNPILEILSDGKVLHSRELINLVIKKYYSHLPAELLEQKTKSGDILISNRIAWGKSYLKKGGYIEFPKRGMVNITVKGQNSLSKKLELKDIESGDNFLDFYTEEKSKKNLTNKEIKNSTPQDLIDSGFSQIEANVKSELLDKRNYSA